MFFIIKLRTLLQIPFEFMLYSEVIFEYFIDPDDKFQEVFSSMDGLIH